jgi:hypothetical protein
MVWWCSSCTFAFSSLSSGPPRALKATKTHFPTARGQAGSAYAFQKYMENRSPAESPCPSLLTQGATVRLCSIF